MHKIFWLEDMKRRDHLKDLGVDGRIILEWILVRSCDLDASRSGEGSVADSCEHGNELLGYIKRRVIS
jgi:hypothetical protein